MFLYFGLLVAIITRNRVRRGDGAVSLSSRPIRHQTPVSTRLSQRARYGLGPGQAGLRGRVLRGRTGLPGLKRLEGQRGHTAAYQPGELGGLRPRDRQGPRPNVVPAGLLGAVHHATSPVQGKVFLFPLIVPRSRNRRSLGDRSFSWRRRRCTHKAVCT